ncbi:HNH endonuclease [Ceratobasidium sp. AG-Ba]|nr:HNH endonuclease [Ceratobasidium sp. AG-Ba]
MEWERNARDVIENYTAVEENDKTRRVLSALIDHSPTLKGQQNICKDIQECLSKAEPDKPVSTLLKELAEFYLNVMVLPMRAQGGRTPKTSDHPSRTLSMEQEEMLNEMISQTKRDPHAVKSLALRRDGYRSSLSRLIDMPSVEAGLASRENTDVYVAYTEAAHIIPFSLSKEGERSSKIWTTLENFSGMNLLTKLSGDNINWLGNMLTLSADEHRCFGQMNGWLESVKGSPNTYVICGTLPYVGGLSDGAVVTFTTTDDLLELPDPRLIAIHTACAKIYRIKAAAEHVDRILRDLEELPVLREDGSSDVLNLALQSISVH